MLFHDNVFTPERVSDVATRSVLMAVAELFGDRLYPTDLLAALILNGGEDVMNVVSRCIRPGFSPQDLVSTAQRRLMESSRCGQEVRTRASFSPTALDAIDTYSRRMADAQPVGVGSPPVCILLECTLSELNSDERTAWLMLDIEKALCSVSSAGDAAGNESADDIVPAYLAPCTDLTALVRRIPTHSRSPFDDLALYEPVFDDLARGLHRRQPPHVILTGERGVGLTTIVSEFARRAQAGRIPFLKGARFVSIDCRFVCEDESRRRLVNILAHLAPHGSLVACIDGFASLLATSQGESNAKVMLAALSTLSGKLVGMCTGREFEELIAANLDLREVFSVVEVPEPDVATACQLVGHCAVGLQHACGVHIDKTTS